MVGFSQETYTVLKEIYDVPDLLFQAMGIFLPLSWMKFLDLKEFNKDPSDSSLRSTDAGGAQASCFYNPKVLFLDEPNYWFDVLSACRAILPRIIRRKHWPFSLTTMIWVILITLKMDFKDYKKRIFDGTVSQLKWYCLERWRLSFDRRQVKII